jgi:hypothetical protein
MAKAERDSKTLGTDIQVFAEPHHAALLYSSTQC